MSEKTGKQKKTLTYAQTQTVYINITSGQQILFALPNITKTTILKISVQKRSIRRLCIMSPIAPIDSTRYILQHSNIESELCVQA